MFLRRELTKSLEAEAEASTYTCLVIYAIAYGMYLVIFCLFVQALLANPNISKMKRRLHITFSGVAVFLNSLTFSSETWLLLNTWIVHRDGNGGPYAYHNSHIFSWYGTVGDVGHSLFIVLTDALYIHRFYVIFGSWRAVVALIPVYLAIIVLAGVNIAGQSPAKANRNISLLILSTTVLNILLTLAIYTRLRVMCRETLSPRSALLFNGITAILVESTVPLTIVGVVFGILCATENPLSSAFQYLWYAIGLLSSQLITLRIALGTAWSRETTIVLTSSGIGFDNVGADPDIGIHDHNEASV